jgi:hypothetical protein
MRREISLIFPSFLRNEKKKLRKRKSFSFCFLGPKKDEERKTLPEFAKVNKRTKKLRRWREREARKLNETLQAINVIEMGNVIKTDISSNFAPRFPYIRSPRSCTNTWKRAFVFFLKGMMLSFHVITQSGTKINKGPI